MGGRTGSGIHEYELKGDDRLYDACVMAAALIPIDPGPFTYDELVTMGRVAQRSRAIQTCHLMATIHNTWSSQPVTVEELMTGKKPQEPDTPDWYDPSRKHEPSEQNPERDIPVKHMTWSPSKGELAPNGDDRTSEE